MRVGDNFVERVTFVLSYRQIQELCARARAQVRMTYGHCTLLSAIVLQIQTNGRVQSDLFMNGAFPRHTYLSGMGGVRRYCRRYLRLAATLTRFSNAFLLVFEGKSLNILLHFVRIESNVERTLWKN